MDIVKDTNKKNLGGVYSNIIGIELHNAFSHSDVINGLIESLNVGVADLQLMFSDYLFNIEGTQENIKVTSRKVKGNEGLLFETEIKVIIPKNRLDLRNALENLDSKEFVLIVTDNNGNHTLVGDIDNSVKYIDTVDTGQNISDLNSVEISFTWRSKERLFFLAAGYIINYIADTWILRTSFWDDTGEWIDEASWIDYF